MKRFAKTMYMSVFVHIFMVYQVGVGVVGVEEEGLEERRLENLVHRESWAGELG